MVVWVFILFIFLIELYWENGYGGLEGRTLAFGDKLWLQNMGWRVEVGLQSPAVAAMAAVCGNPS
jgi:hypothetical protein